VAFRRRDFFKQRFSRAELAELLQRAGLKPSEALSRRSTAYKTLGLAERDVSEDELLDMLVTEPTLLRRPMLVAPDRTLQGFDKTAFGKLVDDLAGGTGER
jgi:arsenate reductase-like glutaredoxin family protein